MAVDPRDLCTVADVKALMQKGGPNAGGQDVLIQTEITRASVKIMRDYAREFVPGGPNSELANNATRTFEFDRDIEGEVFLDLSPYDLQITLVPTIVMDPDRASPITITTDEFRLWPQPPSKGIYEAVRLSLLSARTGWPRFTHRQVSITGNWGFPTVPFEANQACVETVIHWITSYPAAHRQDSMDSGAPVTPRSYPMSALDLLCAFKRPVV